VLDTLLDEKSNLKMAGFHTFGVILYASYS